jgi:hypothetical protein
MGDTHDDPTDHSRTTQPHAGIAVKDNFFWPGLVLLVVATAGLISTAAEAAYGQYEWLRASTRSGTQRTQVVRRARQLANTTPGRSVDVEVCRRPYG